MESMQVKESIILLLKMSKDYLSPEVRVEVLLEAECLLSIGAASPDRKTLEMNEEKH